MNAKLLERQLHRLSDAEIKYRYSKEEPDYDVFKKVDRGGKQYYLMSTERE